MIDQKDAGNGRAPGLDLLRAAAIVSVMLYHLSSHGFALPVVGQHGWMGVDLFFVLSGYLVGWQLLSRSARDGRQQLGRFYLDRALRILPAYFVVLALYVSLPGGREGGNLQPLWKYITFTINLWPDWARGTAFSHAWSLCVEAHFYLLLPLVLWLLQSRANGAVVAVAVAAVVGGGVALRAWLWAAQVAPHLQAGGPAMTHYAALIYNPSWARLDGLLGGVVLASIKSHRPELWTRLLGHGWASLSLGVAILASSTLVQPMSAAGAALLFPLVAIGCCCLLIGVLSPGTWISRRPIPGVRVCAILAFSLYLTHKQVYALLDVRLPDIGATDPLAGALAYGGACLAAASVLYFAVERPGMRLRGWLQTRRKPAQATASTLPIEGVPPFPTHPS